MNFHNWLTKQQNRKDSIGRLARALADVDPAKYKQSRRRKPDEHRKWARIIVNQGRPRLVYTFNDAWEEFTQAKAALATVEG